MEQLAGGLETSIILTLLTIGISGKIPSLFDLGIKISVHEISDTLRSIIPGRRKNKPEFQITIEHEYVIITADVPGIPKKNIEIISTENSVSINAAYKDRSYSLNIYLKEKIDPHSIQNKYFNGVLILKYKRIKPPKTILTII